MRYNLEKRKGDALPRPCLRFANRASIPAEGKDFYFSASLDQSL